MIREIIFRGQRIDNYEWVYGDLVTRFSIYSTPTKPAPHISIYKNSGVFVEEEVIPKTVGQFTGAYDSSKWDDKELTAEEMEQYINSGGKPSEWKGRKIFEGDMILGEHKTVYKVCWSESNLGYMGISSDGDDWGAYTLRLDNSTKQKIVIGTIHGTATLPIKTTS